MACESCKLRTARLLLRSAVRPSAAAVTSSTSTASSRASNALFELRNAPTPAATAAGVRSFSSSQARLNLLKTITNSVKAPYGVLAATKNLYEACAKPADYKITEAERKNDEVMKREDGEEVGTALSPENVWHKNFGLPATFSTWSHVTMLHLYLINARVRCFDKDLFHDYQQQLVDHFFFEAEKKMHVNHGITSSALRQRYLKDIFVQWRGLLLAYDEGVIKGDAILASAVWRNLFKGDPDVDPRALVAIVGWLRSGLRDLEMLRDDEVAIRGRDVLERDVNMFWKSLEGPFSQEDAGAAELVNEPEVQATEEVSAAAQEAAKRRAAAKRASSS